MARHAVPARRDHGRRRAEVRLVRSGAPAREGRQARARDEGRERIRRGVGMEAAMNAARAAVLLMLVVLAACSSPYYAQFEPMPVDGRGERVARPTFSIVVPERWQLRDSDTGALSAFEDPPGNGANRLYRTLAVTPVAGVAGDDPEQLAASSLQALQQRHARDGLE